MALKSIPRLKAIFDTHYSKQPKKFIEVFLENKDKPIDEIMRLFEDKTKRKIQINALDVVRPVSGVDVSIRASMAQYAALVNGGMK